MLPSLIKEGDSIMKTATIEAYDKAGVLLGKREEPWPETFQELVDQFEQADIVKLAWRSHVIDVQRELRDAVRKPSKESDLVKAFKTMSLEEQAEAMKRVAGHTTK